MPNRFQRNSIGELVCHVPLNRGSLLKSIENLVKTIETSENAVMIPTLLRDKVRVDAWELLFVAKILKASILGHDDLVEFYMNHIHQNSLAATTSTTANTLTPTAAQTPSQAPVNQLTPNGSGEPLLSPSLARHQSSPSMASPLLMSHNTTTTTNGSNSPHVATGSAPKATDPQQDLSAINSRPLSASLSTNSNHSSQSTSSTISTASTTTGGTQSNNNQTGQTTTTSKSSSVSWITASQQLSGGASLTSGSPFNSCAGSSTSSSASSSANATTPIVAASISSGEPAAPASSVAMDTSEQAAPQIANLNAPLKLAPEEGLLAARPLMARLAQPPSLLQLTTTNNHINSVSEMLNSSPLDPSLDLLSQHLISLQQHQQQLTQPNGFAEPASGLSLSILTSSGQTNGLESSHASHHLMPNSTSSTPNQHHHQPPALPTPTTARHELRSSRSAGCLFRANSGASSPRTPGTPFPQAETLAGSANQNGLVGDPTSIVKLLLQVEQLKASIVHVNTLLESVVELYKKSIDNISQ